MNTLLLCLVLVVEPGAVKRTIDSDTFILWHVGVPAEERVRIMGVDGAELSDSLGLAARSFTVEWLARGPSKMQTCKRDSWGRLLGVVTRGTDTLATLIVKAGLGSVAKMGKEKP